MPTWVFLVQLAWSAGLLAVFIAFVHSKDRLGLPESFGSVPVEAPWLGAVGGLLASFGGIVRYSDGEWKPRFNYWHPIKPLMAAATGGVACLLVIVLARTATAGSIKGYDSTALDGAAFVFGYAESSFRELIKAITNVFLRPGQPKQPPKEQPDTTERLHSRRDEDPRPPSAAAALRSLAEHERLLRGVRRHRLLLAADARGAHTDRALASLPGLRRNWSLRPEGQA